MPPLEAPHDGVHTCHAECPCHAGGEPVPDFEESAVPTKSSVDYVLPAPGQIMVSRTGREYEVMSVWTDSRGRRGMYLRQVDGRRQTISRYLDRGDWRLRFPGREQGEWRVCPACGARYGGVTECPFDHVALIELEIADA